MTLFIGIHGMKRSGKDTLAQMIKQRWECYREQTPEIMAFADPIRGMLRSLLLDCGMTDREIAMLEHSDSKDAARLPVVGVTKRKLMQTLGTEWGRMYLNPDIWIEVLKRRARHCPVVIVPDVRYNNEANAIRCQGIMIHLTRRGLAPQDEHSSESGVQFQAGDYRIQNNFGLPGLREEAEKFVFTVGNEPAWSENRKIHDALLPGEE